MDYYAGVDVSLKEAAVCILDAAGQVICEQKVASEPDALTRFFRGLDFQVSRIGLEAGPLSQWLFASLTASGFDVVLLETRHVKAALSAMTVKTDRRDALGIAHLLRMGWYRPVHCKALASQEVRSLLTARKLLLGKLIDVELGIRGILRGFGLKIGTVTRKMFDHRVRELVAEQETLTTIADAMLAARALLINEVSKLHKALLRIAREDEITGRLMSVPGVGALTALTFKTAIDDPHRIKRSRDVGPLFGLTPRRYQSGETDVTGGISKAGDMMVRSALFEAATVLFFRLKLPSNLKDWAQNVAKRRETKRAIVALARKLAILLHRIWLDGTTYRNPMAA
ncbi:IS110 family transposase [Allosphingosinicella sp.]|uniref:IS110 family transposase n=1 Tax=Allosphingosinicella sp. TaxID=2823234 RepID=UPI002FC25B94